MASIGHDSELHVGLNLSPAARYAANLAMCMQYTYESLLVVVKSKSVFAGCRPGDPYTCAQCITSPCVRPVGGLCKTSCCTSARLSTCAALCVICNAGRGQEALPTEVTGQEAFRQDEPCCKTIVSREEFAGDAGVVCSCMYIACVLHVNVACKQLCSCASTRELRQG